MDSVSLFRQGNYSTAWVKDFYTQAGRWWGGESERPDLDEGRAATIERLCGPAPKRILELGAGAGNTAAITADHGYTVVAVEFSPVWAKHAQELAKIPRKGSFTVIEADFYTVQLEGKFDVICYWDGFGVGSDGDHQRLLKRIAHEWLAPDGSVLMDVFSPIRPAHDAGTEQRLDPLSDVPESVEMIRRCHFDPIQCRWIDEWQPTAAPDKALAQAIRCYTPADYHLLLQGTGLTLKRIEIAGEPLDCSEDHITTSGPLMEAWSYLAWVVPGQN